MAAGDAAEEEDRPDTAAPLLDMLAQHLAAAAEAAAGTLVQARSIGFIDAIADAGGGYFWAIGWIRSDAVFDRAIVIADGANHPAGFAHASLARADVPQGTEGFVALAASEWRPTQGAAPTLFLADGSGDFLEPLRPTPVVEQHAIAPQLTRLLSAGVAGHIAPLADIARRLQSWTITDGLSPAERLCIDDVAILPGFGAFVSGWAISPNRLCTGFVLKDGVGVMRAEERSVTRHPRPDLGQLYPRAALSVAQAGFTALFRGDFADRSFADLALRGIWQDGSQTNVAVPLGQVRVLGMTAPLDAIETLYPAAETENFFPAFARHAIDYAHRRAADVTPYKTAPTQASIIFVTPDTPADIFLLFEKAIRHIAALPEDWRPTILLTSPGLRSLVVSLLSDLERESGRACNIFIAVDAAAPTFAISTIVAALGLKRFAFVGAGTMLSDAGWEALSTPSERLTLLEIVDLAEPATAGVTGLEAFACDQASWHAITAAATPRIDGWAPRALDALEPRIVSGGAFSLGPVAALPFDRRLDDAAARVHA